MAQLEWEESCAFEMEAISTRIEYHLGKEMMLIWTCMEVIRDIHKFFSFPYSKTEEILRGSTIYIVRMTCY